MNRWAKRLVDKLRNSGRTDSFRSISEHELLHDVQVLYRNLSDWLMTRTELDIQQYYTKIGMRRAEQDVPINQFVWALMLGKEQLWLFMQREAMAEGALELVSELEFVLALEQFFDRALYYAVMGYTQGKKSILRSRPVGALCRWPASWVVVPKPRSRKPEV